MAIDGGVRVEDKEIRDAISRVLLALPLGSNATPLFANIGRALVSGTQLRFREEKTPEGTAWKPSQRALAEGGKTLQLTRRLMRSITYAARHDQVEWGTNVIYGPIHQFGGQAGRGGRSHIDARAFLGVSEADKAEILGIGGDFYLRAWNS